MNIIPTHLNEGLAQAIRNRIAAEGSFIFGKVGFWHLVGTGLMIFGIGSATGLGLYGYSQIVQRTHDLALLSSLLTDALSHVQLRAVAQGKVQLEPRDLSLAQGQTVSLSNDFHVLIDPTSTIVANGEVAVQVPSISPPSIVTSRPSGQIPLITNFTVFKSVPFAKGSVLTGWTFLTSAQNTPTHQYCYYTANLETPGFDITVDLGDDGELNTPKTLPSSFDIHAAFGNCVWFRGGNHD